MTIRMLRIETRRNLATWFLPLMLIMAWRLAGNALHGRLPLWSDASVAVRDTVVFVGPLLGGATAWMATRDRRRGTEELLATMPRPPIIRNLVTWAATSVWGVIAYVLAGASVVAVSYQRGAWGSPYLWPMFTGLLAVFSYAALGYALGHHVPSRLTAPLVAVGLFAAQLIPLRFTSSAQFLSPIASIDSSVFYGLQPNLGLSHALLLIGLAGLGLASLGVKSPGRTASWSTLLGASLLTLAGVVTVLQHDPGVQVTATSTGALQLRLSEDYKLLPYTPVCSGDALPVCVHPAFEPVLGQVAALMNELAAPLIGIPGGPVRVEQRPYAEYLAAPGGVVDVELSTYVGLSDAVVHTLATSLVRDRFPSYGGSSGTAAEAQDAIAVWLLQRAGKQIGPSFFSFNRDAIMAAAQRFGALDPARQREWLGAHYAALRAGKIQLEDLP